MVTHNNDEDDVKPDWNAIAKVGIPGVIALFLVWRLSDGFDKFDNRLGAMEHQHVAAAQQVAEAEDLAGRALMTNERVLWVLEVMCANEAKDRDARERCFSSRGR